MVSLLKKFIDLLLYGNFWIATCALAMGWQSQWIFDRTLHFDAFAFFIFFATLFLYAAHRIVGISKLHEYFQLERYSVIATFKSHIQIYAVLGLLGTGISFFLIERAVQLALLIPAVLSLGYVIPFLGERRRLRDLNHLKIFLVAIVWAWVTVLLPALQYGQTIDFSIVLMCLERAFFVFAITLPFDIRDLKVDEHSSVKTLPAQLGVHKTKYLAWALLLCSAVLAFGLCGLSFYTTPVLIALVLSYLSTAIFLHFSNPQRHDYFYSGLMDGTMVLQGILVWTLG